MVTIVSTYKDDLRCESKHIKSGNILLTDAPFDNKGKGEAFSPTDTLAAALGTCMLTVMGIKARELDIDMSNSTMDITKIMESNPRRVGEIQIELTVIYDCLIEKDKQILEYVALNCPVAKSLHTDLIQNVKFNYQQKTPV